MNRSVTARRLRRTAALMLVLGGVALASRPVSAQLGVQITSPAPGSTVGGSITVTASVSDPLGTTQGVQFQLDGANLGAEDTNAPYAIAWNTRTASNGSHVLRAVARGLLGLSVISDPVTVTVFNDTTPPTVAITAPAAGQTVTGTIAVSANASDNVGVVGVQFRLDGAPLGAEDTTNPYSVSWNSSTASPGTHQLTAIARDAAGNTSTSAVVTVTAGDTSPPTVAITAPSSGSTVTGTVTVSANASDNIGVVGVQFRLDGAPLGSEDTTNPYSVAWDTRSAANGSHTLTAVARDAAGNTLTASPVTVTVSNDTAPPTVSITAPSSGGTVAGTIAVSASASDNVAVAGVQFRLDGAPLGAEDTTTPYSVQWDTQTATDGTHTLTAVARDAAGNSSTSSSITVTVSNNGVGRGDVFVGLLSGHVQRHSPDGTLLGTLISGSDGEASGLAFDAARILHVPHWISRTGLGPGNMVARFDDNLNQMPNFGSGYNCNPSSFAFDSAGNVYVGQADCTGDILKFDAAGTLLAAFDAQHRSPGR